MRPLPEALTLLFNFAFGSAASICAWQARCCCMLNAVVRWSDATCLRCCQCCSYFPVLYCFSFGAHGHLGGCAGQDPHPRGARRIAGSQGLGFFSAADTNNLIALRHAFLRLPHDVPRGRRSLKALKVCTIVSVCFNVSNFIRNKMRGGFAGGPLAGAAAHLRPGVYRLRCGDLEFPFPKCFQLPARQATSCWLSASL